jgi:hypothetical protein
MENFDGRELTHKTREALKLLDSHFILDLQLALG